MLFVMSHGRRIDWRQDGKESAAALLLLAPFGVDPGVWDPALPPLVERFCVLRMDVNGNDASDAPPSPYTLPAMARDVLAVLDAAGRESMFLCGLSYGATIAMAAARLAADRIDGLILASPPATTNPPPLDQLLARRFSVIHPDVVEAVTKGVVEADSANGV